MANGNNTVWNQSVAGVCIKNGCVLLARHTYGGGKGKFIIPGGYLDAGETPQDAVKREYLEEVGVTVEPTDIIGIRFNQKDWYVVFQVEYVSGEARSDGDENDIVAWMPINEALMRDDVPDLTKLMIKAALREGKFTRLPFNGRSAPNSLYGPIDKNDAQ